MKFRIKIKHLNRLAREMERKAKSAQIDFNLGKLTLQKARNLVTLNHFCAEAIKNQIKKIRSRK